MVIFMMAFGEKIKSTVKQNFIQKVQDGIKHYMKKVN